MCKCPNCGKIIYVCRNFVCKNYATGGKYYDFELVLGVQCLLQYSLRQSAS